MTRAIIENKKIVGFEPIVEPFNKPTAEEYARRQNGVQIAYKEAQAKEKLNIEE